VSVTAAQGFRAAGVRAGLKASGKPDLALVVNDGPLDTAAGVFTTNRVVAAPVVWSRRLLAGQEGGQPGHARAVVLNSGSANACTGAQGMHDTEATAVRAAGLLGAEPDQVLVCSTGVIGERIDMPVLLEGVDVAALALADTPQAGTDAATAIMTTDTVSQEDAPTVGAGEEPVRLRAVSTKPPSPRTRATPSSAASAQRPEYFATPAGWMVATPAGAPRGPGAAVISPLLPGIGGLGRCG